MPIPDKYYKDGHQWSFKNTGTVKTLNGNDIPSLANADIRETKRQIEDVLAIPAEDAACVSAKTGAGVGELLETIVARIPPPKKPSTDELKALIFDSTYNTYKGVIIYLRIMNGHIDSGTKIRMMSTNRVYDVLEIGGRGDVREVENPSHLLFVVVPLVDRVVGDKDGVGRERLPVRLGEHGQGVESLVDAGGLELHR